MQTSKLGPLNAVSRLTLGGGGIGQGWGHTDRDEAIATLHEAVESGINLIDTAPMYWNCEAIIGEAFDGALPPGVRITSKCQLGTLPSSQVYERLQSSLAASMAVMRVGHIDVFFLHSSIAPDDYAYEFGDARRDEFSTRWSLYVDAVISAFERLQAEGHIGAWGITGIGVPQTILAALTHDHPPAVTQVITNLLDSAGGIRRFAEPAQPRSILQAAKNRGVGVMGIRAVQAGALTSGIDRTVSANHPEIRDYNRAAPYRALCATWGEDPALIAHRYALSLPGVDTLVLGVKNRHELRQALAAETAGALPSQQMAQIDDLGLRA